jgi:hypothetical protein
MVLKINFAVKIEIWDRNETSGLYYKHTMIVNYAFSVINKLEALLTDDARVIIYDRHVFIVQATKLFIDQVNKIGRKILFNIFNSVSLC